jgi:hypothetical protein
MNACHPSGCKHGAPVKREVKSLGSLNVFLPIMKRVPRFNQLLHVQSKVLFAQYEGESVNKS